MRSLLWMTSTALGVSIALGLSWNTTARAQYGRGGIVAWQSESGDLTLTLIDSWGRSCARGTPSTAYTVSSGARGLLYPTDCDNNSSEDNTTLMRFEDTQGVERCVGRMRFERQDQSEPLSAKTVWFIDGAVNGFECSTVGQTFEVKVLNVQPD